MSLENPMSNNETPLKDLQDEVQRELELQDDLPEGKSGKLRAVADSEASFSGDLENAADYQHIADKYAVRLKEVKALRKKDYRNQDLLAQEANLVTIIDVAKKLQQLYSQETMTASEKRRLATMESTVNLTERTWNKKWEKPRGERVIAEQVKQIVDDVKEDEAAKAEPTVEAAPTPMAKGEAFTAQHAETAQRMDMLDMAIATKQSGLGGLFNRAFSKELRDMKKERLELQKKIEEEVSGTTSPSASRGHAAAQAAVSRINAGLAKAGSRAGDVSFSAGEGLAPAGTKAYEKADQKVLDDEYQETAMGTVSPNSRGRAKAREAVANIDRSVASAGRAGFTGGSPDIGVASKGATVEMPAAPKEVALEDQTLDADDADLKEFKKQQRGLGGFFRKMFGYTSKEKFNIADSQNEYEEDAMGTVDPTKRRHITQGVKDAAKDANKMKLKGPYNQ